MSDLRIIITGGRERNNLPDYYKAKDVIADYIYCCMDDEEAASRPRTIIQGGCPDGIDAMGRSLARDIHFDVETFPADWEKYKTGAGPIRNQQMADAGADLCLAFPNADGPSLGTWDMIRRACAAGIETRIYPEADHE